MNVKYRSDIDGLRAVAVLSVIFFHINIIYPNFNYFPGGYVGVDIFFVISGYLITKNLISEINSKNYLNTACNFYIRRLRRIIPALFLVLFISFFIFSIVLLPNDLITFSKSLLSSIFFISNHFFHLNQISYASETANINPLLHTWSLSVEEQFYLFFPFFLILIYIFFKKKIKIFFIIIISLSIILSEYLSRNHPVFNFYFLLSRIFEILIGCYLATEKLKSPNKKNFNNFFYFLGFFLIFFSIFFFEKNTKYPSIMTLFPTIGTYLLIKYFKNENNLNFLITNKFSIFFGKISYSLYLWHFPFISFIIIQNIKPNNFLFLLYFFTIITLSFLTFKFIETPFRNKKIISNKKFFIYLFFSLIFFILVVSYVIKNKGLPNRFDKFYLSYDFEKPSYNNFAINEKSCFRRNANFCKSEDNDSRKKVILIGDSHASVLQRELHKYLKKNNYDFVFATYSFLYLQDTILINKNTRIKNEDYEMYSNNLKKLIDETPPSIIIYHGRYSLYSNGKYFNNNEGGDEGGRSEYGNIYISNNYTEIEIEKRIIDTIKEFEKKNHKIIIIYPVPEVGWNAPRYIMNNFRYKMNENINFLLNSKKNWLTTSYEVYNNRNKKILDSFNQLNSENISIVNPANFFCNNIINNRCIIHDDHFIYYYDYDHLSTQGSKIIINMISNIIKNNLN